MKDVVVTVQTHGAFLVPADKIQQLIAWLQANKAVGVNEGKGPGFAGDQLLNG